MGGNNRMTPLFLSPSSPFLHESLNSQVSRCLDACVEEGTGVAIASIFLNLGRFSRIR